MDPEALVSLARSKAVVLRLADWRWIAAVGADRARFLHAMLSNRVEGVAPGEGNHAVLLDEKGRMIADLRVLVLEDAVLLGGLEDATKSAAEKLDGYIIADDVEIEPRPYETIGLIGPDATACLEAAGAGPAAGALAPYGHRAVTIGGRPAHLVRLPLFDLPTWVLLADPGDAEAMRAALTEAGATDAFEQAETVAEILRIESAVPAFGHELDEKTIPLEAGLDEALDKEKGCYLGQETVVRVLARGHVNWHVRGLRLSAGAKVPAPGDPVFDEAGKEVGRIRSAVASPSVGAPIALARIRREVSDDGTVVKVRAGDGSEAAATVVAGTFV